MYFIILLVLIKLFIQMLFKEISHNGLDDMHEADIGNHVPGLSKFDFAYQNGDHHISRFIVGGTKRNDRSEIIPSLYAERKNNKT